MYDVDSSELQKGFNEEEAQFYLHSKLNRLKRFETESEQFAFHDDSIYDQIFNVSEIFETNIEVMEFGLNLISKLDDVHSAGELFENTYGKFGNQSFEKFELLYEKIKDIRLRGSTGNWKSLSVNSKTETMTELARSLLKYRYEKDFKVNTKSVEADQFLLSLLQARKHIISELQLMKTYEHQRLLYLKRNWLSNISIKKSIAKVRGEIEARRLIHSAELLAKDDLIDMKVKQLKTIRASYRPLVEHIEIDSALKMFTFLMQIHTPRVMELNKNIERLTNEYNTYSFTLLEHQRRDMHKVYKREANLSDWIIRYDTEITPLYLENLTLVEQVAETVENYKELTVVYDEQKEVYYELMGKRSFLFFNDEYFKFIVERSTKLIQSWWRKYGMSKWVILAHLMKIRAARAAAAAKAAKKAARKAERLAKAALARKKK